MKRIPYPKRYIVFYLSERNDEWELDINFSTDDKEEAIGGDVAEILEEDNGGGIDAIIVLDTHTGERLVEWTDPQADHVSWWEDSV